MLKYNENFIIKESEIRSYFLGYFVTDGHLTKNNKTVEITSGDKQIIEDFVSYTRYENKIYIRKSNGKEYYKINFSGTVPMYLKEMGFTSRKTGNEFIPLGIDNHNFKHFVRGLFDGDGCVDAKNNHLRGRICSGSEYFLWDLLEKIKNQLIIRKEYRGEPRKYVNANCWTLQFNHFDTESIFKWFYKDSTICLQRKKEKYLSILEKYKLTYDK